MMDETDVSRVAPRSVLEEFAADSINIEDVQYSALRENLELDARDFEAPTWSLAVEPQYLKNFSKDAVKRQDIIHELIQTEINHVRTLKLMLAVYLRELQDSLMMDDVQLERLFPRLDLLLREHQNFLEFLKQRRRDCLEDGSEQNYCISHIGDILISQFSGELRARLQDSYGVFCSHHSEAMNFYKDQLQNNKKFQNLMRRLGQLAILRRLGIPEGILLITQRITKYPVLVERLIKNTEAGSEEYKNLVVALEHIKDTISTVDDLVHRYEQLRTIVAQIEHKSQGRTTSGKIFRREDILQNDRKLLRAGMLSWPSSNRSKVQDVMLVLLPDLLLLLQEKDQKYIFAPLDGKPAVIPLKKLIVREAAHSERVMYLISAAGSKPDMYELHTTSAEERSSWRLLIWETIERCPHVEEEEEESQSTEQEEVFTKVQRDTHDQLMEIDAHIEELLRQKLQMVCDPTDTPTQNSTPVRRLLLRGAATELQQGEQLVNMAITYAESLQREFNDGEVNPYVPSAEHNELFLQRESENLLNDRMTKGRDGFRSRDQRPNSDPHLRELYLDSVELAADDYEDEVSFPSPPKTHTSKLQTETTIKLIQTLYSLKALVSQQDSELELRRTAQSERRFRHRNTIFDQERQRHLEKQRQELLNLQKVHQQQREEQETWARERQRYLLEKHEQALELRRREERCTLEEAKIATEREELAQNRQAYQQDLERLRDSTRAVAKEREKLEHMMKKYNKYNTITNLGKASFYEPAQSTPGTMAVDARLSPKSPLSTSLFQELPPQVPPRKESIIMAPKPEVPIQLLSTSNQLQGSETIRQQIPTKLSEIKGREKSKSRTTHHRSGTAATIEMPDLLPIKVSGKEGGSLHTRKSRSPRTLSPETYIPPDQRWNSNPSPSNITPAVQPQLGHHRSKSNSQEDIFYF